MSNYTDELKKAIQILENATRSQSTIALRINFSMSVHDFNEIPDELRLESIDFLNQSGFRLTKWTNDSYKDKPGGSWTLRLAGGGEFTVYDGRMIGNEQS
jgi:hypothetical protein